MPAAVQGAAPELQKDEQTYANFYWHPAVDGDASHAAGKTVHKDVIMVEVFIKGSRNTSSSHIKTDADEKNFPREWQEFLTGESPEYGTPLDSLPNLGPSAILNLKAEGIQSVEDLAGLSDGVALNKPGMIRMRQQAQAYLQALEPEKLEAERQQARDREIALQAQLDAQQAEIDALKEQLQPKPRKRRKRNPETGELE